MPVFDRILVPLDGSPPAETALAYAALLPSRLVRLLLIEPETTGPALAGASAWEVWRVACETEGTSYLEQAGARLREHGRTVETAFAFGDPADWIIAFANDADLIVMTTHGRGDAGRALFGSVADRVVRHGRVPTLLVRGQHATGGPPRIARVLVPLDGSPLAARALPIAVVVARELGIPVHLLRVVEDAVVRASVEAGLAAARAYARSRRDLRREAADDLDAHVATLRGQQVAASAEIRTGSAAATLLDAITPIDLVVMTTHGYGGVRRWMLGSVADKLVREAAAPVLLVREPAATS